MPVGALGTCPVALCAILRLRWLSARWLTARWLTVCWATLSLAILGAACGGKTHTLVAPHADPGEVAVGLTLTERWDTNEVQLGSVAYSGSNGEGDAYWVVNPRRQLVVCRQASNGPMCRGVSMSTPLDVHGFLPDTGLLRPLDKREDKLPAHANRVWLWGVQRGLFRSSYYVGLCDATTEEAVCHVAPMPRKGDIIAELVAVNSLSQPTPDRFEEVAWFSVLSGRGFGKDGQMELVRCSSRPSVPLPSCAVAVVDP